MDLLSVKWEHYVVSTATHAFTINFSFVRISLRCETKKLSGLKSDAYQYSNFKQQDLSICLILIDHIALKLNCHCVG